MRTLALGLVLAVGGCGGLVSTSDDTAAGNGEDVAALSDSKACAPTTTVEGVDLADGQGAVDWTKVRAAGVRFGIVKATQGTYNTQSRFAANWSGMKAAGVIRGAYHFFDPTEDGVAQAKHFVAVMGALSPGDLPPMLDIECPDGDNACLGWSGGTGAASAATIRQRMTDFINYVQSATGRMPLLYTFGSYFSSNGVSTSGLQSYPLNIAYPTTSNCFNVPSPWTSATMWQYSWTGSVSGISGQVDRDRFLGDIDALLAFAGGSSGGGGGGGSGGGGGGGGGPPPAPNGCNSATLAKNVPSGTCVQASSDGLWYHCDNGAWVSGETGCTTSYPWCQSPTLGKSVPPRSCVQSRSNSVWYQCDAVGWDTPVADGAGPLGACSAEYSL
ncbi:MAG TPA: GH25 family lysozyme [Polyangia bacterium]|nr:GH25 family lysozyme [Polyangia bacterium]